MKSASFNIAILSSFPRHGLYFHPTKDQPWTRQTSTSEGPSVQDIKIKRFVISQPHIFNLIFLNGTIPIFISQPPTFAPCQGLFLLIWGKKEGKAAKITSKPDFLQKQGQYLQSCANIASAKTHLLSSMIEKFGTQKMSFSKSISKWCFQSLVSENKSWTIRLPIGKAFYANTPAAAAVAAAP